MKSLIFDAGPIISLATNNLLWLLEPLKKEFRGEFYITEAVKKEIVTRPLESKKFKFEAIQVERLIEDGALKIIDNGYIRKQTPELLGIANDIFEANSNCIKIVHFAEVSVIAAAFSSNALAIVIDEKTTRLLLENPRVIAKVLERTLETGIKINEDNLKQFKNASAGIKTIRSVELVTVAYEKKLLDRFITHIPNAKKNLLEGLLWGLKLNGCAVSRDEISEILEIEASYGS